MPVLTAFDSDRTKYEDLIRSIHQGKNNIESLLNEFSNDEIIEKSRDVIDSFYKKSVESINDLKNHDLFPILENINNYLINRTN